jgi:hypothetical protein
MCEMGVLVTLKAFQGKTKQNINDSTRGTARELSAKSIEIQASLFISPRKPKANDLSI